MKVPFSYRNHFFRPVLIASFLGHAIFLGTGGSFVGVPRFSVKQAPTSMEVLIIPEKPVRPKVDRAEVLSTEDDLAKQRIKVREKEKQELRRTVKTPLYQPRVKGVLTQASPDLLRNQPPVYPQFAREHGWQGVVILKVFVRNDGRPAWVRISRTSGYKILDEAALHAVRQWQFLPARMGNFTFASTVKIPVRFVLTDEWENINHE